MGVNESSWLQTVEAFSSASLNGEWLQALSTLADATGSRSGELIGLGQAQAVPFNLVSNIDENYSQEFIAMGGADPELNPIVREGTKISELTILSTGDFITPHDRRYNSFIVEHINRYDVHHVCLTPLVKNAQLLIGLAVMRSSSQGEISRTERKMFASLAPHIRAAVKMQLSLEHKGGMLISGALEAMSLAVFLCDSRGRVQHMTPEAETIISQGGLLNVTQGVLKCRHFKESQKLRNAIALAASNTAGFSLPKATTLFMNDVNGPLMLEVFPLPQRDFKFVFEPKVMVVVKRKQPNSEKIKQQLFMLYNLTPAEADVALRLIAGESPERISHERSSRLGTVRTQIRSIYSKCAITRCSELIFKINQIG